MDVILETTDNCSFVFFLLLFLFIKFIATIQFLNHILMRKSYASLRYLIRKQLEILINVIVKYFNSILQAFFHCDW